MALKRGINALLRRLGYEIRRTTAASPPPPLGVDPFVDMRKLITTDQPIVFDVGANVGQTIRDFHRQFTSPVIHSFEPGPDTFEELKRQTQGIRDLHLNNLALGSTAGIKDFFESSTGPELDSLLLPSTEVWGGGGIKGSREVRVSTVDAYCQERGIGSIDILKTDTQGYDLEVLRGASGMFRTRSVKLVCIEILFGDMYKGQPRADEVYGFLMDHGFDLVTFYGLYYWGNKASWADALFKRPDIV